MPKTNRAPQHYKYGLLALDLNSSALLSKKAMSHLRLSMGASTATFLSEEDYSTIVESLLAETLSKITREYIDGGESWVSPRRIKIFKRDSMPRLPLRNS